jgi:hypothetical protein
MLRKVFILMTGILFITAIQAGAMMGGHGSGGNCTSGQQNTMQGQGDHMMGNGAHDNMHNGDWQSMSQSGSMGMDRQTAEAMMDSHMQNQNIDSWSFGSQRDHGSNYMTDIMGPNGEVIDRLSIDKRTGNLRSLGSR